MKIDQHIQIREIDLELNVRMLNNEMAINRSRGVLRKMYPGQRLHISASNSEYLNDYKALCKNSLYKLIDYYEDKNKYCYVIEKLN